MHQRTWWICYVSHVRAILLNNWILRSHLVFISVGCLVEDMVTPTMSNRSHSSPVHLMVVAHVIYYNWTHNWTDTFDVSNKPVAWNALVKLITHSFTHNERWHWSHHFEHNNGQFEATWPMVGFMRVFLPRRLSKRCKIIRCDVRCAAVHLCPNNKCANIENDSRPKFVAHF